MKEIWKQKIDVIPYEETEFVFIDSHYDYHLSGLCRYKGELCYFISDADGWQKDEDGMDEIIIKCFIYFLTPWQQLKLLTKKKIFELCVGYHWTYPYRGNLIGLRIKNPKWFFNLLFNFYYHKFNFKKYHYFD